MFFFFQNLIHFCLIETALPAIVDIMGEELNWSKEEKEKQIKEATNFLASEMGQIVNRASRDKIPIK